jgi:hypothetical protein
MVATRPDEARELLITLAGISSHGGCLPAVGNPFAPNTGRPPPGDDTPQKNPGTGSVLPEWNAE